MTSGPAASDQAMASALDEVAEVAEVTALEQQRLVRRARSMSRKYRLGRSWSQILQQERQPGLLDLLARSARRLVDLSGRFRQTLAQALVAEGLSTRQVAKTFGVTHQRISAMMNRPKG